MEFHLTYPASAASDEVTFTVTAADENAVMSQVSASAPSQHIVVKNQESEFPLGGYNWQLKATVTNNGHTTNYRMYLTQASA